MSEFGQSVAFTGEVIAVDARKEGIIGSENKRAAYLLRRLGDRWVETGRITYHVCGDESSSLPTL